MSNSRKRWLIGFVPRLTLFEALVLLTIFAILCWANSRLTIVQVGVKTNLGVAGFMEWHYYGWPLHMVDGFKQWIIRGVLVNAFVGFVLMCFALTLMRIIKYAILEIHPDLLSSRL